MSNGVSQSLSTNGRTTKVPSWGPEPTLVSRKEMDVLYLLLEAVTKALDTLEIDYIVTGGSLLGAIRQSSILFCDDDVDISILDPYYDDPDKSIYKTKLQPLLPQALRNEFRYKPAAWEGGDRVYYGHSSVFLDLFVIRKYHAMNELESVLGVKANGQMQSPEYVSDIVNTITEAASNMGHHVSHNTDKLRAPFWHFAKRKAVELWPREVYRDWELWPLTRSLQMGPCLGIAGPRLPVLLLKRAFGHDCFDVYYPSIQHGAKNPPSTTTDEGNKFSSRGGTDGHLPPKVLPGGTWQHAEKTPLNREHYLPIQPTSKAKRRTNTHCKEILLAYLEKQRLIEERIVQKELAKELDSSLAGKSVSRPRRTVYMDGVFDLFHVGHLAAIRQCAARGDRVILGVTGDQDATGYKRKPIIPQEERVAIVSAMAEVDKVICPCPLVVTESFMKEHDIDLVVHGFMNDNDAQRQAEFFAYPIQVGKFERIPYYEGQSTTDIMRRIKASPSDEE